MRLAAIWVAGLVCSSVLATEAPTLTQITHGPPETASRPFGISNDGHVIGWMQFTVDGGFESGPWHVFVGDDTGANRHEVTTIQCRSVSFGDSCGGPSLSGDGRKIAFGSCDNPLGLNPNHRCQVFLMNSDGTGLTQLPTNGTGQAAHPALNYDGSVAVYEDAPNLNATSVISWHAGASNVISVDDPSRSGEARFDPSIDDSGVHVAYQAEDFFFSFPNFAFTFGARAGRSDGSERHALTPSSINSAVYPGIHVSRDGGTVLYTSAGNFTGQNPGGSNQSDPAFQAFTMSWQGGPIRQLTDGSQVGEADGAAQPMLADGSRAALQLYYFGYEECAMVWIDTASGATEDIFSRSAEACLNFPPMVSGDGLRLAFGSARVTSENPDGRYQVFVLHYPCAHAPSLCDDHNPCTDDLADDNADCACSHAPSSAGTPCDADACTLGGSCDGSGSTNGCVGGTLRDCDDGNPCTNDSCDPITGCVHTIRIGSCDDGNACTSQDACSGGACHGFGIVCEDNNPCTDDSCQPAAGCVFTNNDHVCSDGNSCTINDTCHGGACVPGPLAACDDGNACTTDRCDPVIGCIFANNANPCDDGNPCTTGDACFVGACRSGAPTDCSDGNPCTDDNCYPAGGGCAHAIHVGACSDDNACTTGDTCVEGACEGLPRVCDDGETCTTDSCDPATGCVFANNSNACDDGNACTTDDTCGRPSNALILEENFDSVTAPSLPAGWTSTVSGSGSPWTSQATSGESTPNWAFGVDSDQTADEMLETPEIAISSATARLTFRNRWNFDDTGNCYDAGVLEIKIGATAFADIVAAGGSFVSGGYTGTVRTEYSNPLGGRDAWCSVSAGYPAFVTTAVNLPSTAAGQTIRLRWRIGSDSSIAAVGQEIDSIKIENPTNACNSGPATDCNDHNPCTDDSCDPATGCVHASNTAACDDGNACTAGDVCAAGACAGSIPVVCPAPDQCHTGGSCDPAAGGCTNTNLPDGTVCNDNNVCTQGESCQSGTCTAALSGLNEPNPRSNGYYKSLCHGPHSGDALTDADAVCVSTVAHTFAGISTVADLCAELEPSHPNNDACDRTDDDLMVLALNICRARVCTAQSIDSQCGGNGTVAQSLAESDAILGSSSRTAATCARAKCLDEEINTGGALELNSLTLGYEKDGVRLRWSPPYLNDGTGHPSSYHVWRRPQGSLLPFRMIVETSETTFLDTGTGAETFAYEVTPVMH